MEGDPRNPRVSLLKKYDIPIDHLSYEYVEKCSSKKDLERIVRILRSGEEGSYPDLLKVAEERLRSLAPESRVLRVETPILTKECLTQEEWKAVENDLLSWEREMSVMDKSLDFEKSRAETVGNKNMPSVRKVVQPKLKNEKTKAEVVASKDKRIRSGDYAAWDKFDVDKELLKIDVEEERKAEENEKRQREAKKLQEKKKIEIVDVDKENYSSMEQQVLANQAKDRGNECYKFGDLESALKYYDVSIRLHPTANAYNNRAMTYLKLKQYENAVRDCNTVLQLEKQNIKALHRRATAYQNMAGDKETTNYDRLALQDLYEIVYLEPNNKVAQSDLQKLKKKLNIEDAGKKFRMHISEEADKKENCTQIEGKNFSGADNRASVEKLPLTYYGPSTSSFQCEPYSMMHRALSGSSVPGQVLCKCNSSRPKQNPLCQKCGEAMCTPKPAKAVKGPRGAKSAAAKDDEGGNELSETRTSEPSGTCVHSSRLASAAGRESAGDNLATSDSGSGGVPATEQPQREVETVDFKNKADDDANNNSQSSTACGLGANSSNVGVPKKEADPVEEAVEYDKGNSNLDKRGSGEGGGEGSSGSSVAEAAGAQGRGSGGEVPVEVEPVCLNGNGAIVTASSCNKEDNIQNSKKSKHKKKKSKDQKDGKVTRKHLEPLKIEPVKVVHAAKYLHPTSFEPKVRSEAPVESQQETNVPSGVFYKAFVPNRRCYSSESNRMSGAGAAPSSACKQIPKQVVSRYSALEGNKENISECRCNRGMENGGEEEGAEEAKKEAGDSPYEFMKTWEALKKLDESYTKRAEIIRRIKPSDLGKVIGIKLDSDMLSCLLECLLRHFVETDPERVAELLSQLPRVPRYGLVSMFLADADKKKMKKLVETAEGKGFKLDEDVKKNLTMIS